MKQSFKRLVPVLCIALAMMFVLSGCRINLNLNGKDLFSKGEKNVIIGNGTASKDVKDVNIEWVAGDVTVVFDDVDEIVFEETAAKELDDDKKMRYEEEDGKLSIHYCKGKMVNNVPPKNLKITLPEGFVFEEVKLEVVSAEVSLPGGFEADKLVVDCVSGDIDSEGEVKIETVEINAVSGDVTLDINGLDSFSAEAVSGDVTLILPSDAGFTVDIDGINKNFTSDFDMKANDKTYVCGNGETKIKMDSISGDMSILKKENAKKF